MLEDLGDAGPRCVRDEEAVRAGTRARSLMSGYGNVIVGKLNLKKKSKKKRAREEAEAAAAAAEAEEDALVDPSAAPDDAKPAAGDESGEWLTESEKRVRKQQRKQQARILAQVATMTHRDKVSEGGAPGASAASSPFTRSRALASLAQVEEFNEKLGNLTEHNDIPRISAAGNG